MRSLLAPKVAQTGLSCKLKSMKSVDDTRDLRRRVLAVYHQDGLAEMIFGAWLLSLALSIVLVCVEAVRSRRGETSLAIRWPWIVAFAFGLLHGFGFAGALAEVGLPQNEVPLALLMFNVGVEVGQLIFVVAVLLLRRLFEVAIARRPAWVSFLPPYAIGTVAMFWVVQRVSAFWA